MVYLFLFLWVRTTLHYVTLVFFQDRQTTTWDVFETGVNTGDIYHISTSGWPGFCPPNRMARDSGWSSTAASDMFFLTTFNLDDGSQWNSR